MPNQSTNDHNSYVPNSFLVVQKIISIINPIRYLLLIFLVFENSTFAGEYGKSNIEAGFNGSANPDSVLQMKKTASLKLYLNPDLTDGARCASQKPDTCYISK